MSNLVHVKINSLGAKSVELTENHQEKIIAIGGSTTECNTVDQPLTWTEIAQQSLSKNTGRFFWVGNFGKSGNTSEHNILQTQELLKMKELADVKTMIYLIGINDALKSLHYPERYLDTPILDLKKKAFMVFPDNELSYLKRLSIFKFVKEKRFHWQLHWVDQDIFDNRYQKNKENRANVNWAKNLPNLTKQINRYKENIRYLISLNIKNNKRPIFITQPVLWHENLDPNLKDLLVFDLIAFNKYTPDALAELMTLFNKALIEVCEKENIHYIDLANEADPSWFYDDCHFNLIGSKRVGELISKELETLLNI